MYLDHFQLRDKPFRLAHHPNYYYPVCHQEPLDDIFYSIEERQSLALLVGESGTGKTSLLRRVLQSLHDGLRGVFIADSFVRNQSVLARVASELGLSPIREASLAEDLEFCLLRDTAEGRTTVVLIDEAQGLTPEQFDEVRFLSNIEHGGDKLLEIVLAGQPSIESKLAEPGLAALRQRVSVLTRIQPLGLDQTAAYIEYRLRAAGAREPHLFTSEAITKIRDASGGIPRIINIVCERSMLVGYVQGAHVVGGSAVEEALSELDVRSTDVATTSAPSKRQFDDMTLARLDARFDAIEERLDRLIEELRRAGVVDS